VLQRGYNLLRQLSGHAEVHLFAFIHPDVLPTEAARDEGRRELRQFCESVKFFELWPKRSPLHRSAALALSSTSSDPFSVIAHRSERFRSAVSHALRTSPFDLVHADTLALRQFVDPQGGVPAVVTHHNIESVLMDRRAQAERGLWARFYLRREARKLRAYELGECPRFDVNIVMSPIDEQVLLTSVPGIRTAVVPNGVDLEYFKPSEGVNSPALIYTGGMNMFANRDAVLYFLRQIWPLISADFPNVRFYAVGQDPPNELQALADTDPRIVVTGYVSDIRPLVRDSSVYVVPLRVGGGTRLKVLDAMAMGKALVSTSIGCEGLDVQPGEHLVVADTPAEFAQATLNLLRDPARRRGLGCAARGLVEHRYAWPAVAGQLLDAYRQAIDGRRAG